MTTGSKIEASDWRGNRRPSVRIHSHLSGNICCCRRSRHTNSPVAVVSAPWRVRLRRWGKLDPTFIKAFACIYFPQATDKASNPIVAAQDTPA